MAKYRKAGSLPLSNGKWKKYHKLKFLRGETKTIDDRLAKIMKRLRSPDVKNRTQPNHNQQKANYFPDWQLTEARNLEGGYIPKNHEENQPSASKARPTANHIPDETPMEEGEISSESEPALSVMEVPTIDWANYLGVKSVQYTKIKSNGAKQLGPLK